MDLFHFTSVMGIKGIFKSGVINLGSLPTFRNKGGVGVAISLTSSDSPVGHGLPDGRELRESEYEYLRKHAPYGFRFVPLDGNKIACLDHTAVRLRFSHDEIQRFGLRRAMDYYSHKKTMDRMAVTAYLPSSPWDGVNINRVVTEIRSGRLKRKDHTWWLCLSPLPVDIIKSVAVRSGSNPYHEMSLSDAQEIASNDSAEKKSKGIFTEARPHVFSR
jgi:hypothetical protein